MKKILFIFILCSTHIYAADISLNEVRQSYQKSITSDYSCKILISSLKPYNVYNNITLTAYKACAYMIMAKHVFNPISKLSYFNQGKELLEECVKFDSEIVEIRYLRFTVQSSAPSFLGYNQSIIEDKIFLLNAINNLRDSRLKKMVITFLKSSKYLSLTEKQKINQF